MDLTDVTLDLDEGALDAQSVGNGEEVRRRLLSVLPRFSGLAQVGCSFIILLLNSSLRACICGLWRWYCFALLSVALPASTLSNIGTKQTAQIHPKICRHPYFDDWIDWLQRQASQHALLPHDSAGWHCQCLARCELCRSRRHLPRIRNSTTSVREQLPVWCGGCCCPGHRGCTQRCRARTAWCTGCCAR